MDYNPVTIYQNGVLGGQEFAPSSSFSTDGKLTERYSLVTGDELEVTYNFASESVGAHNVTFISSFLSGQASNYTFYTTNADYTISKAPVTITTNTAEKEYDSTALVGEITVEGLAVPPGIYYPEDQRPVFTASSITDVGSITNAYTVDWRSYDPDNYTITENLGTLTITPLDVEIRMRSETVTYNNAYHDAEFDVICNQAPNVSMEYPPTVRFEDAMFRVMIEPYHMKDAGTSVGTGTVNWMYGNQDNYNVTVTNGTYTVLPAPVTIKTGSASKVYDGTPLTKDEVTVIGDITYGVSPVADGFIIDAGSTDNTYSIYDTWNLGNYTITDDLGSLTVYALDVNCHLIHNTVEDSYELTVTCDNPNFTVTEVEPSGAETNRWNIAFSWGDTLTCVVEDGVFSHFYDPNFTWHLTQSSTP